VTDTIPFIEDKILLGWIVGLRIVILQRFSRKIKDSPKSVARDKITLDTNSENPLCCLSSIWGNNSTWESVWHTSIRCSGPDTWAVEERFLAHSKRVLTTDCSPFQGVATEILPKTHDPAYSSWTPRGLLRTRSLSLSSYPFFYSNRIFFFIQKKFKFFFILFFQIFFIQIFFYSNFFIQSLFFILFFSNFLLFKYFFYSNFLNSHSLFFYSNFIQIE